MDKESKMTEFKSRNYVVASALGAYFGLYQSYGTSPMDQLEIDLGNDEAVFDDAAIKRMDLGKILEAPVLDYFENLLNIKIIDRNQDFIYAFDDMLKGIIDGDVEDGYLGIPTGVECKISNSSSGPFTKNLGYIMQCQAYMKAKGYKQWLLLGLYNGKPIYELLTYNEELANDMEEMINAVFLILNGIEDVSSFPYHLVEKYAKVKPVAPIEASLDDMKLFDEYLELKDSLEAMKETEARLDELEEYFKNQFLGAYTHLDGRTITISAGTRKGSYDIDLLSIENPELDLSKYKKPDSEFKKITVKKAPKAKA